MAGGENDLAGCGLVGLPRNGLKESVSRMPPRQSSQAESASAAAVIIIVEDDSLVSKSVRSMLEKHGWTVDGYATGEAFLNAYHPGRGACLLVDADLPGISGVDVLRQLQREGQRVPVIMITGSRDGKTEAEAVNAGAMNFIKKPIGRQKLLMEVERVLEQTQDASRVIAGQEAAAERIADLTPRQREIMERVLAGQSSKNIAADLAISQRTVETHRAAIMKKTGSKSLPALARLALSANLIGDRGHAGFAMAQVQAAVATPDLAGAFESDQFCRFFDQIPMAIIVAAMSTPERIIYANPSFEQLSGQLASEIEGKPWASLRGRGEGARRDHALGAAIVDSVDCVGTFQFERAGRDAALVDVYSSVIVDDGGNPAFRLATLVDVGAHNVVQRQEFEEKIREKDTLLLEIQHRVKNNLQMITALIRMEARNVRGKIDALTFDRLAGRINSIQIIYDLLSSFGQGDEIDLGIYLSQIASSVMQSHAVEGIRLDLKVDAYPVSVNVALPTGMVANELLTNALKHAFVGRDGGTITLHSLSNRNGCRVVIADDGIGLPDGVEWPKRGKLGELIVHSLRQNAKADLAVESESGKGTRVTITFTRAASAPVPMARDESASAPSPP